MSFLLRSLRPAGLLLQLRRGGQPYLTVYLKDGGVALHSPHTTLLSEAGLGQQRGVGAVQRHPAVLQVHRQVGLPAAPQLQQQPGRPQAAQQEGHGEVVAVRLRDEEGGVAGGLLPAEGPRGELWAQGGRALERPP